LYKIFENVSQTENSHSNQVIKEERDPKNLVNLKKFNEKLVNNCVVCMSNCVDDPLLGKNIASNLTDSNIIMDLLYLCRDGFNLEMRKNCGGLIARLTRQDERHLLKLRELNGIELLHSCLKNANI
jgi:hypothetical protein